MEQLNKNEIKGKIISILLIVAVIGIISFSGCIGEPQKEQTPTGKEIETKIWVDHFNISVEVPTHPKRIISLSKADTEILFTIGVGDRVVGRSSNANHPPEVLNVPDCGSASNPNFEVILNQNSDLIILYTSDRGINAGNYKDIIGRFEKYNLSVVVNPDYPYTIYEVMDYIKHDGKLVGEEEKAEASVNEMNKKINFVEDKVKNLKEDEKPGVGVISTISSENIFASELTGTQVEIAGGINAFEGIKEKLGSKTKSGTYISPESLIEINPDVIIISYMDYSNDVKAGKTEYEVKQEQTEKIKDIPGWQALTAVKNNRICVIDAYKLYGTPRVADGLIEIGRCIHPELFGIENVPDETKKTKTFTDDLNRTVEIPKNPEKIVVIATADVEILFAINASDKIIGRPNFQKYPPEALKIDDIGGMYPLNLEKIMEKNPDLILITMTFKEKYIKQVEQLGGYNLTVLAFNYPNTMDDIINHIKDIGEVVGKENEANDLVENITFRINKITMLTNEMNESQKPKVYKEWINEGSKGSTAGRTSRDNELIVMSGGKNIFGDVEKTSFEANSEEVVNKNPEVIIITTNLDKYDPDELKKVIKTRPRWGNIDAVKNNRICVIESQITWANPRLIRGLEEFAKCIHPELFNENVNPVNYFVNYPTIVTDGMGRNVTIHREPKRIVSGHPAPTENLFALGVGDKIILRSDNCEYPPDALKIPDTTYPPSIEFIVNSSPDVVFVYIGHTKIVDALENLNITVVAMPASKNYNDIIWTIKLIGKVVNKVEEAEKLTEELNTRVERIKNNKKEIKNPPKVLIFGGTQTMAIGNGTYINEAATTAGGVNIFSDVTGKVDNLNMEVITARNPDIIILPHAFYDEGESVENLVNKIKNDKLWQSVDAVKNNRFCLLNRDILFSRTPRYVDTIEQEFNCFNEWETKKFCNSNTDCASGEFCNTTVFACKSK